MVDRNEISNRILEIVDEITLVNSFATLDAVLFVLLDRFNVHSLFELGVMHIEDIPVLKFIQDINIKVRK